MDIQELLRSNLGLVERLARFVCRNAQVVGADVDDFASAVKLALIEDDYAILRAWEGGSSLATYLTVIMQRMLADERFRSLGRWRPSAEAKRLGDAGIQLEMLLVRDERSLADSIPIVRALDATLTAADVEMMAARLPVRASRAKFVELRPVAVENVAAEGSANEVEVRQLSQRTSAILRDAIAALPIRERMMLRLRFVSVMSVADIARILNLPQRPMYRRLEQILAMLRGRLAGAGIDARAAADVIGSAIASLDFGLADGKNGFAYQTNVVDGTRRFDERE